MVVYSPSLAGMVVADRVAFRLPNSPSFSCPQGTVVFSMSCNATYYSGANTLKTMTVALNINI